MPPLLRAEVAVLLAKDAIEAGPSSRDEVGVLQPVLHRTQERRWVTTNLGPARPEPGPSQAPVQDADAETHFSMHPSVRLVRSDRPEGRVLSCPLLPRHRPFFALRFEGEHISTKSSPSGYPCRSCLHQGSWRAALVQLREAGHSRSQLPRRLAHIGPVSSTVVRTQGHGAQPPQPVGASGQLGKEQNSPCAEDLFSRYGVGLGQPHSTSLSGACSVDAELPGVFPVQEGGSTETLSEAPGAYGIRSRCHAARIASYETASALASRPGPEMAWRRGTYRVSVTPSCRQTFGPWSDLAFLRAGVPPRQASRPVVYQQMPLPWAGEPCATGMQLQGSGQGPGCSGISIDSSC